MIYFAVFLISASCLFVSPMYWPEYLLSSIFLILSIPVLTTQFKVELENISDRKYSLLIFIPTILIGGMLTFPFNLGFLLFSIGIILTVLLPLKKYLTRFNFSLMIIGLILIVVALINPLFNIIVSRFHDISFINLLLSPFLKLFNLTSFWESGNLYIQSTPGLEWVLTTIEKTGIYFSVVFFIGGSVVILLFRQTNKIKSLLLLFVIQFVYIILRYVCIIIVFLNSGKADVFWNRSIEILTFLPLLLILYKFIPLKIPNNVIKIRFECFNFTKKKISAIISISLLVFTTSSIFLFHDPGKIKEGNVLLDEYYSDWEWTEEKLDTAWYGKKSLYNYYCLAEYISHYYHFERNFNPITYDLLKKHDILILKTPTSPFSENEINAIRKFVFNGGGLLLIGDHTNVFGTSTFMNPLANTFGIKFNYDATYDFKTGSLSVYKPPDFYSHPVVQSMPSFLFGTSCTLDAPLFAENVIIGYGLKAAYLDYSKKNFFSTQNQSAFMKYGLFLQSAGIKHGKGRVLAFTDSTVFSNFWMFMPGKPELFLGFLNWLNRMNTNLPLLPILIILNLILIWLVRNQLKNFNLSQNIYLLSFIGGIVFILSYFLFSSIKFSSYSPPKPHTTYYRISLDNEYSDIDMPILTLTEDYNKSYNTLYIALQRLGYFPNISNSFKESLKDNDLVIIINSEKEFPVDIKEAAFSFLKHGGKLLILEESVDKTQFSNNLIKGLKKVELEKSFPLLSTYESGKGKLYILNNSILYNDVNMGIANAVPNNDQLKNIRLIYTLIDFIAEDD